MKKILCVAVMVLSMVAIVGCGGSSSPSGSGAASTAKKG